MTLDQLFIKYGSDKSSLGHNYSTFYTDVIPADVTSILEIGVKDGASIQAFRDYYPNAKIYGLDLFTNGQPVIEGVTLLKGNQLDHSLLYHIRNDIKPDVIVEDCSHNCADHWVTLFSTIPSTRAYIIEDLHTCEEVFYQQGLRYSQTVLGAMIENKFPFRHILRPDNKIAAIYANPNKTTIK